MKKEFIYVEDVKSNAVRIQVNLIWATSSILWNNNGQYGLIPFAKIQNALENWKDTHVGSTEKPKGMFYWHKDLIFISPQIANALLGEDKDDKCTYKSKSSPKSS